MPNNKTHDAITSFFVQLRMKSKKTQEQIANDTGISLTSYQRFEEQKRDPRLSEILTLCDFYGVTLLDIACSEIKIRKQRKLATDRDLASVITNLPPPLKRSCIDFMVEILPYVTATHE